MSLSPIAKLKLSREIEAATDWGAKPELRWLPLEQLGVDYSYQRHILEVGRATIRRIVQEFRWSRFGQLVVAVRGERYAVIDGQHRAAAAFILGIDRVPCIVITCTLEEEAEAFAAINGNVTRPSALQIHSAKVVAGDRNARAIRNLCDDAGVSIPRYAIICDKPGMCTAIGTLDACLRIFGRELLTCALKLLVHDAANVGMLKPAIIGGTCQVLKHRPALMRRERETAEAMARVSIAKVYTKAKRVQSVDGGSVRAHFVAALEAALDRELASGGRK